MNAEAPAIDPALLECEVGSFAIDSREVKKGDVFFALSQPEYKNNGFNGDFDDSTAFVRSAIERGAAAFVARRERSQEHGLNDLSNKAIYTDDAIVALQNLARGIYLDWNRPVVGITGSAGKTTAKELTAHVLSASGLNVLKNIKNYNNGLGLPLTVLRLAADPEFDAAVLEMGMSTPQHEIERLCAITRPDVAVVLNVLPVHVEHLGSIENVAKAKAEIIEGMKPGGTAVLNSDDPRVAEMRTLSRGKTITYGIGHDADVRADNIKWGPNGSSSFSLSWKGLSTSVDLPLNGKHNVSNALAAAAVGLSFGIDLEIIAKALSSAETPEHRGVVLKFKPGFTVIDDSYNSNPAALRSMVETLVNEPNAVRRIVVAGEMLELGPDEAKIHRDAGERVARSGVDKLIGVRGLGRELVAGAMNAGLADSQFVEDSEAAADIVSATVRDGDVVLIKGSRGVRTEKIIDRLMQKFELEDTDSRQD